MEDLDYGRFERAICDGVQFAAADPERLKRERQYQLLQAASRIFCNAQEQFDVDESVTHAIALLTEIESRSK